MSQSIFLSIVTPTYNEEETISECVRTVAEVMSGWKRNLNYEHIIIDNASSDRTVAIALNLAGTYSNLIVARNDKNMGGARSIYRGLALTRGEWVVPMLPADLQDPAESILHFLESIDESSNVVFGVRTNRKEFWAMRLLRTIYYKLIRKLSFSDIPIDSGDFCLVNRDVVESILDLKDENPYVRGLIAQAAKSPKYVEYSWGERKAGKSKATPLVLAELAISGLVSTSQIPARVALIVGFTISFFAGVSALIQALLVLFAGSSSSPGIATIIVSIFFFGGLQLFFIGLIGEYVLSIHKQVKRTPEIKTRVIK